MGEPGGAGEGAYCSVCRGGAASPIGNPHQDRGSPLDCRRGPPLMGPAGEPGAGGWTGGGKESLGAPPGTRGGWVCCDSGPDSQGWWSREQLATERRRMPDGATEEYLELARDSK